jgi:predicted Zn-dependent protease
MTSILPFVSNGVFESADLKLMSDAYSKAIENIHGFGRPNRIVGEIIAGRIIALTQGGERDPDRLCARALAACGFSPAAVNTP